MTEDNSNGSQDLFWSKKVAELAVDALIHANAIAREKFDEAVETVAEEILVRLSLGDRPKQA